MKQLKGKKALAAILTAAMTMSLMACGSSDSAATEEKPAEETQETAAAETTDTAAEETTESSDSGMDALIEAAKAEGKLIRW